MAKENPNQPQPKVAPAPQPAPNPQPPEMVPKAQYDALLNQAQGLLNEANARIETLEKENRILQDTLATINKLVANADAAKTK